MPELPEVETTRRGIEPHLTGRRILECRVHEPRLRWPVDPQLPRLLAGVRIERVERRAKYLLLRLADSTLIVHLGMSGSLRVLTESTPRQTHDHIELQVEDGTLLRFNDPRRFGCWLYTRADPLTHPLLARLAPEPLDASFDADYLRNICRGRKVTIKQLLMNGQLITGVGNIYASEALFHAGIRPTRMAGRLKSGEFAPLVRAIRQVLKQAIRSGGTTLRDYVNPAGNPGYFRQKLYVYERAGEPCRVCATPIRQLRQGQRSTYYCPTCQH
ncbi:MAG: bifunctional DNA-formamidopyrimidine glycosylase/DNA-(apurinic or apyrimidinic site) lyase [Steroidobacteraceae bacterium]